MAFCYVRERERERGAEREINAEKLISLKSNDDYATNRKYSTTEKLLFESNVHEVHDIRNPSPSR